jgi:hypothetical protein
MDNGYAGFLVQLRLILGRPHPIMLLWQADAAFLHDMEPGRAGLHDLGKSGDDPVFQKLCQMLEMMLERTSECLLMTCCLLVGL